MSPLIHHAALVAACLALGAAGLRAAAACGADGLLRLVAAAPLAVAVAVAQALALGRVDLAASPVLLLAGAVLAWVLAREVLPAPAAPLLGAWRAWWPAQPQAARFAIGAAAGAWVAWTSWQLRFPHLDVDGLIYHLPLVASWMPDGDTGAATPLIEGLPVGNYPLTNEVALAWMTGITHSLVPMSVWSPMLWALAALAAVCGLRALGVDRLVTGVATAALLTMPLVAVQLGGPLTDLPALTWAVVCAALCAASTRRPSLLGPAIVAAGLAVGTKTTPAPLLLLALGTAAWHARASLLPLAARTLAPCVALGAVVGLAWMTRNLVDHGSPLWPFVEGPGSDPLPPALRGFDASFLDDPSGMLSGRADLYLETVSGGFWLLVGALLVPLLRRTRAALLLAAATVLGVFFWMNAPYTGIQSDELAVGATRYLLPALACATVAVAVATSGAGTWTRRVGTGVLMLSLVASLLRMAELGFPYTPSVATIVAGGLLGAAVVGAAPRVAALEGRVPVRRLTPVVAAGFATLVMAGQAEGYLLRHAGLQLFDRPVLGALLRDPTFTIGEGREVAMAPAVLGSLVGERLQHRVLLIPADEPCATTRARRARGWVIAQIQPDTPRGRALVACMQGEPELFRDGRYVVWSALPPR
ncbi:hypothetical protein [Paraconexibacter algicola]|uniref:Glycosyltransferase RgtA/B/C/D-like domain-containing protein n=1 Tax=Paraconexibacter algicola TaxID=2133960 RepID=A0A2T4UKZ6_9ACTN|nr:hypothetical protein [Paraconexibacter algicola]PTL59922.1 hypothetical protein C7Y72_09825 [Paraconexibacter algicola]